MEIAADTTAKRSPSLAAANEQCEVSSTTDGLTMPAPNSSAASAGGGNGNKKQQQQQSAAAPQTARAGGVNKFHQFRTPTSGVQQKKKMWNKRQKCHHNLKYLHHPQLLQQQHHQQQHQQSAAAASKADLENIQNIKNQIGHHRLPAGVCTACGIEAGNNTSQQTKNPKQQVYKKMLAHRACNSAGGGGGGGCGACNTVGSGGNGAQPLAHHPIFCSRSKFFLPDKRPRKEVIIPPTKFLLGGNISDPLNLNSLQNEANSSNNNTPATTPRRSPITTPPKVEVIIPPNIHDPLHLLDPVDTMEYEKQLTSPMKRKSKSSKSKHRNRKKKTKRRRFESVNSVNSTLDDSEAELRCIAGNSTVSTADLASSSIISTDSIAVSTNSTAEFADTTGEQTAEDHCSRESVAEKAFDFDCNAAGGSSGGGGIIVDKPESCTASTTKVLPILPTPAFTCDNITEDSNKHHSNAAATGDRESVKKDLRLDLSGVAELQQQHFFNHHHQQHHNNPSMGNSGCGSVGSCSSRKRKVSEGACSAKNKFRRMDSMDKIVSPVVPQPGAWKRPPRLVPTGGRKTSRHRSTSVSETELLSPAEDSRTITDTDSIRADTPDIDSVSKQMDTASMGSPLRIASVKVKIDNTSLTEKNISGPNKAEAAAAATTSNAPGNKIPKLRPEEAKYQYGNYDRYSGYRQLNEFMDVRLHVFQRNAELFRGKDILDIGCNVGHMTISVGRNLAPKSILGIDIDKNLIARARKNLSMYVRIPKVKVLAKQPAEVKGPQKESNITTHQKRRKNNQNRHNHHHRGHHHFVHHPRQEVDPQVLFPVSFPLCYGGIPDVNRQLQSEVEATSSFDLTEFPKNVYFRQTNYVLKDESLLNNDTQQYDIILCLSVTKWLHLNFGDNGLKTAFKRMFNQLRPGGKLILEAQNWASYKKKKNLTQTIYNNYKTIEFFPNKFHEYLLSNEVGFSHSHALAVPRHMSKGFSRPIHLYAKGDFTPNHVRWSDAYNPTTPYEAYRGIYATMPRHPHPVPSAYDTPIGGNSGSYSCRQTPMHQPTSQYYNPLETDSYLPSYDIEVLNQLYVFASPLYQTVWSPPASMRNSSSHTPLFGSVREIESEEGAGGSSFHRHVYPPNDDLSSPNANGAFNSIRDADTDDSQTHSVVRHVYANCESSSSPHVNDSETQDGLETTAVPFENGCNDSNES